MTRLNLNLSEHALASVQEHKLYILVILVITILAITIFILLKSLTLSLKDFINSKKLVKFLVKTNLRQELTIHQIDEL